jgi:hypothetical protein
MEEISWCNMRSTVETMNPFNVAGSPKEVQSGGAGQGVVVQGDQAVGTGMNIVTEIIGPIASATEMNDMIVIITEVMKGGVTLDGGVLAAV